MKKNIIIADDHPITAKGMEVILKKMGFQILGNHRNGIQALNQIITKAPDFVLLDVQMPGLCGVEILEKMREKGIKSKTIIYTMFTNLSLFERAIELDVNGYLLKEFACEDLEVCLKEIEKGKNWFHPKLEERLSQKTNGFSASLYCKLTVKERNILSCIANNKSTKEIAEEQFLSEKTIESHRRNIIKKLELPKKNNALLAWSIEHKDFFSLID